MRGLKKAFCATAAVLVVSGLCASLFAAEPTAADRGYAAEEFRRGVQAYYRGAFNEAVLLFEKALSYLPDENLILEWLGKAYYRSGIEGAAIQQWEFAADSGYGGLLLENRIETVRDRRISDDNFRESARYVEAGVFPGRTGETMYFNQPISALPLPDGSCWVLAYGSNELLRFDVNGMIVSRMRGPLGGFDRPMDIMRQKDGRLLVSEYAGNRISQLTEDGVWIKSFGTRGRGNGELVGPQYMAEDSSGNIYVTDFGNARVVVFGSEGEPLFTFGTKDALFPGLAAPAGIAVMDDIVYVADAVSGSLYSFDTAGNYTGTVLLPGTLVRPEALRSWGQYLLAADTNRVLVIDTADGSFFEAARTGNSPSRITCAVPDVNGNLLVTDFRANEVYVMSKMADLVGGLFVQIERVISDAFPQVTLEVRVENRRREPIVGLKDINFFVTEEKRPVAQQRLAGAASNNDVCDITVVIDRSPQSEKYGAAIETAVREIAAGMNGKGTLRIVSAGDIPVLEMELSPDAASSFSVSQLKARPSDRWAFDLAVRLAANDLINGEKKRGVVFLSAGQMSENAFDRYGLADIAAYLNNNGILFSTVYLDNVSPVNEIDYITGQTGGDAYYVYRPEGLRGVVSDFTALPNGSYQLTYTSSLPTDFGRAFLPVEVETYLLNRSGRDETGYFAPLE